MEKKNLRVYIALGGNIGDSKTIIKDALDSIKRMDGVKNFTHSRLYDTAPVDVIDSQNWFVNAVCSFDTLIPLKELFHLIQKIEINFGKIRKAKNCSRPIDLDLLFYGDLIYKDQELEIPHPRWKERLFVLIPLADLTHEIVLSLHQEKVTFVISDLINTQLKIIN